ncbi:MAG: UDP-N-acetylmuramate dehydrogenase [Gaiella sp.]
MRFARLTTIGVGGPARAYAECATVRELSAMVRRASAEGMAVVTIGLGSNVLAADTGVEALVIRLVGELAAVETEGTLLRAGAGATNAVCLHRARDAGLGGLEFACAIPGTAGGGVRMNAGAYGSDWSQILVRAFVVSAEDSRWVDVEELGLSYRHSSVKPGEVVAQVEYRLTPRPATEIRAEVTELVARRKATQPTTKRTFGSVWKNPPGGLGAGALLDRCGLKGFTIGGARISPMHANFIENAGDATAEDCLALMAESRRRVREHAGVELEHEVVLLGGIEVPRT